MKKRKKRTLFYSYVISYVGVILIALSLAACLTMWSLAEGMKEEEIRILQNRLNSVANDLEEQMAVMRSVTLNVASQAQFRQDTFSKNKYLEYEMLNSLTQYNWIMSISDFFFLKYQNMDNIFTSQGTTVPFALYGKAYIGEAEWESVSAAIEKTATERKVSYVMEKTGNHSVLLIYPLKKYAASSIGMDGVMCFEVKEKLLEKRMKQMAGELTGNLEIYCDDFLLLCRDGGIEQEGDLVLEAAAADGDIRVVFQPESGKYFDWNNIFSSGKAALLAGAILLLLIVALHEARKNYAPIRKLVRKYNIQADALSDNELDHIDSMIASMVRREEENGEELKRQYRLLREQLLYRIAAEGYSPGLESRMTMLNIQMNGAVFGKIFCDIENREETGDSGGLITAMEELSDDGVSVYALWVGECRILILVSAEEEYQIKDIEEAAAALLEAGGFLAEVRTQGSCWSLSQLGQIGDDGRQKAGNIPKNGEAEKESHEEVSEATEPLGEEEAEDFRNQSTTAIRALKYIDENYTRYDLSLDLVAREFHITSPYLCRLIKQQTGMNYKEYLTRLRMAEAKKLLQDKKVSIADVCEKTGYSNVSHFIKTFLKYEGTTPAKYRDVQ